MLLINSDAAGTSLHPSQRPTVGRVGPSMSRGSRKLSWIDLDAGFLDDLGPVRRPWLSPRSSTGRAPEYAHRHAHEV
jgi:hypothetical protein